MFTKFFCKAPINVYFRKTKQKQQQKITHIFFIDLHFMFFIQQRKIHVKQAFWFQNTVMLPPFLTKPKSNHVAI